MAKVRKREGKRGVSWQIDYFDPNGKRVRQSFKKKKDAEEELAKRRTLIAENPKRYLEKARDYTMTLGELLDKYTENYEHQTSFQSWKNCCIGRFKTEFGEETRIANIRYVDLETYRNKLRKTPTQHGTIRSDASVNREISCLHHIFAKAGEWEMAKRSPFDRGKTLLLKENNTRLRFLSKEEIDRLLPECHKYLKRIVECAIHTGMRRGEILSLKWSQIRNGYIYLTETKTSEPRQVPIDDDLAEIFKEIRKEYHLTSEYVFTYQKNEEKIKGLEPVRKRMTPLPARRAIGSVKTAFKTALKNADIENFKFHDLRHTFASQLIMRGGSLKEVQEILGHKTMTMTMRYAHLSQEHKKKAVNRLNGLTAPAKPADSDCHKTVTNCKSRNIATGQVTEIIGAGDGI